MPAMHPMRARADDARSDPELARVIAGQLPGARDAEAVLCARFARRVFLYGLRHLGNEQLASDLVQEVMTVVLTRLRADEVRELDRIASFVLGTARMIARDLCRRERRTEELAGRIAAETDPLVHPRELLDLDRLADCLHQLPERERSVVVLTFMAEQSASEIASTFGLSSGHVRVIRHRAVSALARCMDPVGGEP
jgi:RNA polymerase sigma-70 factor, ECF subfamily